jgi:hypothetical protein
MLTTAGVNIVKAVDRVQKDERARDRRITRIIIKKELRDK